MPHDDEGAGEGSKGKLRSASSEEILKMKTLRQKCVAFASEIEAIAKEGRASISDSTRIAAFKGMSRALEKFHSQYVDCYFELCSLAEMYKYSFPSQTDKETKENVMRWYYQALSHLETLSSVGPSHSRTQVLEDSNLNASANHLNSLPKLSIPQFNGDPLSWRKFRDSFASMVHDTDMPAMRKYHYLKLSLVGPAASAISHLPMDADSYHLAWTTLTDSFANPRLLAATYLNEILNFNPIHGKATLDSLKLFLMKINDSVSAFKLLHLQDESSFILFHLGFRCLDPATREKFELEHQDVDFPKFDDLIKFVKSQCTAMQLAATMDKTKVETPPLQGSRWNKQGYSNPMRKAQSNKPLSSSLLTNTKPQARQELSFPSSSSISTRKTGTANQCVVCHAASHPLLSCKVFSDAPLRQRLELMKNFKGCSNCLSPQHTLEVCASKYVCKWCKEKHNSAICQTRLAGSTLALTDSTHVSVLETPAPHPSAPAISGSSLSTTSASPSQVLLGTAIVLIQDARGQYQTARLVADSGSHYSFLTRRLVKRLGLNVLSCSKKISGIGQTAFEGSQGEVQCSIRSTYQEAPVLSTTALVVKEITSFLPTVSLPYKLWSQYLSYPLADPKFYESRPVDILLGCDLFGEIWNSPAIVLNDCSPRIFPTIFGHMIIGRYSTPTPSDGVSLLALHQGDDLLSSLRKFWETEEPIRTPTRNPEDVACEQHFLSTYYRKEDGSYVVKLPFKRSPPDLRSSFAVAKRRFLNLEEKLKKNKELHAQYSQFLHDYIDLKHMSRCLIPSEPKYFIPHHSVVKVDRNKIKLRVVFDASTVTPNSTNSLNSYLMVGPKLQNDIKQILLGFRSHPVVFVADIVHFFRSIWLDPPDQLYQCILWRFSPTHALETYQLHTLTYGMTSSPFLACAVTRELANTYRSEFPLAADVLVRDTYIDDTTSGAANVTQALELQAQLIELLSKGGFKLSKWASNEPQLLEKVSETTLNSDPVNLSTKEDVAIKILGMQWDPVSDCFMYTIAKPPPANSKRSVLSAVSRIYDPLGLLSPYVISLKAFIQALWKLGLDWDSPLPDSLAQQWHAAIADIETIGKIRIPRFVCVSEPYTYQLVGFCDSSSIAYAACIFIRIICDNQVKVQLLTAKTKLAPLRTLTIPRLELCGACLLTELFSSLSDFCDRLTYRCLNPVFFTDSSIVLSWLNTPSYRLRTYVCNRVTSITDKLPPSSWRHVESSQNPADPASRGLSPHDLRNHQLWWHGPSWLTLSEDDWPQSHVTFLPDEDLPEVKPANVVLLASPLETVDRFRRFIARFSSYMRLLRVVARLLRLSKRAQRATAPTGPLLYSEIREALHRLVKFVQLHYFFLGNINNTSATLARFVKLNPFFDSDGLLRAGGRLYHASLPYDHRHPILLPADCHLTELMVDHFHYFCMHPGPSQLQAIIQTRFWVPSLRRLVQKRTFLCKRCYEFSAKTRKVVVPIMANLPASRLQGVRAFLRVGCDFMGPLSLRESNRRKAAVAKVYVCLFICMATKAIHLEPVTSLTCDGFLAAFDRFLYRRGLPSDVYSDCGTNFVAAASNLKNVWQWYQTTDTQNHIADYLTHKGIQWHFNPPHGPHFGGLWEAGVKSTKRLFLKTVGDHVLTFEELATLLTRIEAVLNSRPLCPLSSDPSECDFLSPGHFLIGCPLLAPPEESLLDERLNRLDRWQLIQRMSQHFWHRWRVEYLATLQSRAKWTQHAPNLKIGDLVILKEDHLPMLRWPTGRVEDVHPGSDQHVRVATVRTPSSTYKRPVAKLIPLLPLSENPYSESS